MKTVTLHAGETLKLGKHVIRFVSSGIHKQGQGQPIQTAELQCDGPGMAEGDPAPEPGR